LINKLDWKRGIMVKTNKNKIGFVLVLIVIYLAFFGIGSLLGGRFGGLSNTPGLAWMGDAQVNILFMGIDARGKETNARSDTMILASIDKRSNKAVLVWIPRDTRIEVGKGRYDKINSVNALKGPEAACQAVGKLLNTRVDYYVLTNFQGFAKIVDTLGGVHIDVETNMRHFDPDPTLNINLSKGTQLLNGADALRYVRYRGGPTADIGRTARQQKFIKAVIAEMFTTKNIFKLPELVPQLIAQVKTNLPAKEVTTLANLAQKFSSGNVVTQTLPGYSFTEASSGASYWQADEKVTPRLIAALFNGETFKVIQDPPNWVAQLPAVKPAEGEAPVVKTPEAVEELEQAGQPEIDKPADKDEDDKDEAGQDKPMDGAEDNNNDQDEATRLENSDDTNPGKETPENSDPATKPGEVSPPRNTGDSSKPGGGGTAATTTPDTPSVPVTL
jgi:LCP family protein required for cell wall assembly